MDDEGIAPDWQEIISQLRLEAGRIAEDVSVELAMRLPVGGQGREKRLRDECETANDMQVLLSAARVLLRRCLKDSGRS